MPDDTYLKELGNTLHARLTIKKDYRVSAEIAEVFLPLLVIALKRRFPNLLDPHQVETIAIDTIMSYLEKPEKYDPSKSSLIGYLYMDSYRDMQNLLKQNQKYVELHSPMPEHEVKDAVQTDNPEIRLVEESSQVVQQMLTLVIDPVDRELVSLMMMGVRETEVYASVLGIEDRPLNEQVTIVKRHKDRLKAALRRRITRQERRR